MTNRPGRVRDPAIDERVLAAAGRQLAAVGYSGMSLAAIAEEAGTTRQAIYRRWQGKAELAEAVVLGMTDTTVSVESVDPFADLVTELSDFRRGVSKKGRLSLVGTMLQDTTEAEVQARYRTRVVAPRRRRLRAILERGVAMGYLDANADLEIALTMCTGSWYGRALAGSAEPPRWPVRTASLIWRALGGTVPIK